MTHYGYVRDLHDERDLHFAGSRPRIIVPTRHDFLAKLPPVFDQGQLGSCTANGSNGALRVVLPGPALSRLFTYWNTRNLEGTVSSDAGGQVRDAVKVLATLGAPPESEEAYVISHFKIKPTAKDYSDALKTKLSAYRRAKTRDDFTQCLAQDMPVVIGFSVPASFESQIVATTGVWVPKTGEKIVGGHCTYLYGYDTDWLAPNAGALKGKSVYHVRNSWGTGWGDSGNFHVPAAFIESAMVSDCWMIEK